MATAAAQRVTTQAAAALVAGRVGRPLGAPRIGGGGGGGFAASKRTSVRPAGGGRMQVVAAAAGGGGGGFGNGGAGPNIPNLVSALLTALGVPHTIQGVRKFLGGGGGGNGGGFDAVRRLIDYFFRGEFDFLPLPCVPCDVACRGPGQKVNVDRVVGAMENLVRGMDAVCRATQKKTLIEFLYEYLTVLINSKIKNKQVPILKTTGIRRVFKVGKLLQYDVTRGVRVKILDWVFANYVDYYLGGKRLYNLKKVNAALFSQFRPQVIAFLQGTAGDLAPVVGFLTRHLIEYNKLNLRYPSVGCMLCNNAAFSCEAKLGRAKVAVAKAALKRVPLPRIRGAAKPPGLAMKRVKVLRAARQQGVRRMMTTR